MAKHTLDTLDIEILSLLQGHGRMHNAQIAHAVGLSAPSCLRRIKYLEDNGYIGGYKASINEEKCGFPIAVFTFVRLKNQTTDAIDDFNEALQEWDMVRESYMISGEHDYILRVIAPNWTTYKSFLTDTLTAHVEVASVRSNLCIGQNKNAGVLPFSK